MRSIWSSRGGFGWSTRLLPLLMVLVRLLAGCGGSTRALPPVIFNTPTAPAPTTSPLPPPVTYVAMGASDALGVGADDPATQGYVPLLIAHLPKGSVALNVGVSGILLHDALQQELPEAIAFHPTLITVWLVGNDFRDCTPLSQYAVDLNTLLAELQSKTHAKVFVANAPDMSLLPYFSQEHGAGGGACVEGASTAEIRALALQWNAVIDPIILRTATCWSTCITPIWPVTPATSRRMASTLPARATLSWRICSGPRSPPTGRCRQPVKAPVVRQLVLAEENLARRQSCARGIASPRSTAAARLRRSLLRTVRQLNAQLPRDAGRGAGNERLAEVSDQPEGLHQMVQHRVQPLPGGDAGLIVRPYPAWLASTGWSPRRICWRRLPAPRRWRGPRGARSAPLRASMRSGRLRAVSISCGIGVGDRMGGRHLAAA